MKWINRLACVLMAVALSASSITGQQPRAIDDAALLEPAPTDWLTYGRDYAETRFSPLDQIRSDNVHRLGLAWYWDIDGSDGRLESTPLVANGIMYATGTWNIVFALDARTGALKWRWDPAIVRGDGGPTLCCNGVNRGVALYRGKVYVGLLDGRLVALDAETGQPVWVRQTTPRGSAYSITGAPRIVNGMVVIGNAGAEFHGVRGYVTAYDAETGDQVWRFYTVPGDPSVPFESPAMEQAAKTWAGEWWTMGGGGTVWDHIAYDPDADLLYIGVGNGSPHSREMRSAGVGDNLYLASIVALNADNGEMVWYYQTAPGDDWDYTATQHMILADLTIDGRQRKVLMQAPKNGFFYVLDRITGELISAEPFAHVTWAAGIDMETGRPIETPEARYDTLGSWLSPNYRGAHNWPPMSWNPGTGLVYIPAQNTMSFYRRAAPYTPMPGGRSTGTTRELGPGSPEPPPEMKPPGFLLAWDPVAQKERWRVPHDTGPRNGGTLTSAGNLVFSATLDGRFSAHAADTGETLWEIELASGPATPMTYELDGKQYVTILAGPGGSDGPAGRVWTFALDGQAPMPEPEE